MKYTTAQLASKKQRVEFKLKQECNVIDQVQKQGFLPDSVESTFVRINQTKLAKQFSVTAKTINLALSTVLWNAKKLKQQLLTTCGDLKRNCEIKYRRKSSYNFSLFHNRHKPMTVSLSL